MKTRAGSVCMLSELTTRSRIDWHASIDKSEVLEKYAGFHSGILTVIEYVSTPQSPSPLDHPLTSRYYLAKQARSSAGPSYTVHPSRPGTGASWW